MCYIYSIICLYQFVKGVAEIFFNFGYCPPKARESLKNLDNTQFRVYNIIRIKREDTL